MEENQKEKVSTVKSGASEEVYIDALRLAIERGSASISSIQIACSVGYGRACKILERMESEGFILSSDGVRVRKTLITMEEFEEKFGKGGKNK